MRDSDQEYPLHQPGQHGQHHPFDDDTIPDERSDQGPFQGPPRPGQGPRHQREAAANPQFPRGHLRKALIIGVFAGLIAALQGVVFTLANASLYHRVGTTPQDKLTLSLAEAVVGLLCLTLFISLIIYFIAGFITGKVAVDRRMGFLAAFVAEAVAYILGYIVQQIPGYPGAHATGFSGGLAGLGGGILTSLILLVISGFIAGLVGFFGAWLATRKHPYYTVQ
jgi:hypothetical protein